MKTHEKDMFKTLENGKETATDRKFLRQLADWVAANESNVNVAMRLYCIAEWGLDEGP